MTYDERQEIGQYLDIVKKNCQRLMHSVELMYDAIGEMKYTENKEAKESAKEDFLKHY